MAEWLRKFTVGTGWGSRTFNVDVELYADKPTMLAVAKREYGRQPKGTDALTHCFTDGGDPQALIRLSEDDITIRIVAHEAAHAAVHLTGLLTDSLPEGDDEKIPWLVGSLTDAIWALGLEWKDPEPWITPNLRKNRYDRGVSGKHYKPRTREQYDAEHE